MFSLEAKSVKQIKRYLKVFGVYLKPNDLGYGQEQVR